MAVRMSPSHTPSSTPMLTLTPHNSHLASHTSHFSPYTSYQHLCDWDGVNCENLGVSATSIRCLTNPWDISSGGDPFEREVTVKVGSNGNAVTDPWIKWSYANLWSSKVRG